MRRPSRIPFAIGIAIAVTAIGILAVNAADAPKPRPEDCVAQYFQLCPNVPPNESAVRACITAHKASFHPSCLELAKGIK